MTSWLQKGLRFRCTGCGKCCTGAPGYVFLTQSDLEQLAAHFHLSPAQFARKYCRFKDGKYALLEDRKTYDCVFLRDNRCIAYEARPIQCRTYPWWVENLRDETTWQQTAQQCEGIDHPDAPLIPASQIEEQVALSLDSLLEQNFSL